MGGGEHTGRTEGRLGLHQSRSVGFYGSSRRSGTPRTALHESGVVCRGSGTLDAPTIGLQVAPFSVAPTEQIANLLAVAREPRLADAAAPGNEAGGNAMGLVVRAVRQIATGQAGAHAAEAGLAGATRIGRERRAAREAQHDGCETGMPATGHAVRVHPLCAYEPVGASVRPRDSSNGPMSGAFP